MGSTRSSEFLPPGVAAARIDLRLGRRERTRSTIAGERRARTQRGVPLGVAKSEPDHDPVPGGAVRAVPQRERSRRTVAARRATREPVQPSANVRAAPK